MRHWRLIILPFAVAAIVAPLALGSHAIVSAKGEITGSGTSYTLGLENTGDEAIKCMRYTAPAGVKITAMTAPSGWIGGIAPDGSAFGAQNGAGLQPKEKAAFAFTTSGPIPEELRVPASRRDNGDRVHISKDCQEDEEIPVTGPAGACQCTALSVALEDVSVKKTAVTLSLSWRMTCEGAAQGGCSGGFSIVPPSGIAMRAGDFDVSCEGDCAKKGSEGDEKLKTKRSSEFSTANRSGKTFVFTVTRFCDRDGSHVPFKDRKLKVVFRTDGSINEKKSRFVR